MAELSREINHRDDFGLLCNQYGLRGVVAEIGTHHGAFADAFLRKWQGDCLTCVDTWEPYANMPYNREMDKRIAAVVLARHIPRIRVWMMPSVEAATRAPVGTFQFVYIDADHSYESVMADLRAWWPVLPANGILAGHDYCPEAREGVVRAVDEFAGAQGRVVYLTHETATPGSWYLFKGAR